MSNARSATAILIEIRDGLLVQEASEAIKEAIAAVRNVGKAATVSIDLKIEPMRKGAERLTNPPIVVTGEVSSKLPEPDVDQTLFFVDADGNLTRNPTDERQPSLGLHVATEGGKAE